MKRIFDDPLERDYLASRALERAKRFDWRIAAHRLLNVFDELDPAVSRAVPRTRGAHGLSRTMLSGREQSSNVPP
jgi:hypothetical protein